MTSVACEACESTLNWYGSFQHRLSKYVKQLWKYNMRARTFLVDYMAPLPRGH